jgi:glucosamine-6-phosphate deaminase
MTHFEERQYGKTTLKIFDTREEMGRHAAEEAVACLKALLKEQEEVNLLFAAAPSQNEFLAQVATAQDVDWSRVNALHMDEYVGLDPESPQTFRHFLKQAIFDKVPFKQIFYINSEAGKSGEEIIQSYRKILEEHPLDIVFMGIGENGHIAFNDPPVADFEDPYTFKIVDLDLVCREQQVHDKTFATLEDVPKQAYTVTIPTIMQAQHRFCIVPTAFKAPAVQKTLEGPVETACPASIIQNFPTHMYVDRDAAEELKD